MTNVIWQNVIWREINCKQYSEWDRELIMTGLAELAVTMDPFRDVEPKYRDAHRDALLDEIQYIKDEFGMPNDVCEKIVNILDDRDNKIFLMYIDVYKDKCEITSVLTNKWVKLHPKDGEDLEWLKGLC